MQRDFAFIQTAPDRLFVGWGPFEQLPFRRPDRPAFFIADFFLDDPHPWRHPSRWEELTVGAFCEGLDPATEDSLEVAWEDARPGEFEALFDSASEAFARGDFRKIVPVVFEHGRYRGNLRGQLVRQLAAIPRGMLAYGYSYQGHGMIGATPELLFRGERHGYSTMALAGTRTIALADELLHDPKERREHRLVVDDIVRRLAPFGNIEIGPVGILRLPTLAHLVTPIFFVESGVEKMVFSEMVRRLHPTAALGVSPRNEAGERWLRQADRGVKRRTFGAPFGLEREDRSALAVVAIRNVQWNGEHLRIGSGAGLLPESRVDRELEELRHKREQVKALFDIGVSEADRARR